MQITSQIVGRSIKTYTSNSPEGGVDITIEQPAKGPTQATFKLGGKKKLTLNGRQLNAVFRTMMAYYAERPVRPIGSFDEVFSNQNELNQVGIEEKTEKSAKTKTKAVKANAADEKPKKGLTKKERAGNRFNKLYEA